jgi:bis(5'-nucleosyl)-tetraphosphatase (symmetrical)
MATYVIGDIHGCMDSLQSLLTEIAFGSQDNLWLVGDLVNRGPKSLEVLRWALALGDRVISVLGNHDLYLLARAAGAVKRKKHDTLDQVLDAADCSALIDWLRHRALVHCNTNTVMVHAGLHPLWTVNESALLAKEIEGMLQSADWKSSLGEIFAPATEPLPRWSEALGGRDRQRVLLAYFTRVRTCFADGQINPSYDGELQDIPRGFAPWFALPEPSWSTHRVLFGHWAALGFHQTVNAVCLDSGCVWGNRLTALRLDDDAIFSVEAKESLDEKPEDRS